MPASVSLQAAGLWLAVAAALAGLSYLDGRRVPQPIDASLRDTPLGIASMETLDGGIVSTASWRDRLTLVNFWATWCRPCVVEIPDLVALQNEFPDDLRIIGLAVDEPDLEWLRDFVDKAGLNYPVASATPEVLDLFPEIEVLPTSFLIDKNGRLAGRLVGRIVPSTIRSLLRSPRDVVR